jgi:pantoate--beta-alanine ligase
MKVFQTVSEMRVACRAAKHPGVRLGVVPTMGALHAGHLSLVQAARSGCGAVAATIFVNPTQFGPNEDLNRYPRTFDADCELLEKEEVDFLFAPSVEEMYPAGTETSVTVEGLSDRLCGNSRPGHFRGVTTVVSKLFHIIEPDAAFFGQKDAAQVAIIRRMVRDLNIPVEIVACPIVRDADGLAMSSRNSYLAPRDRKSALVLFRSLLAAQKLFDGGERSAEKLLEVAKKTFAEEPAMRLDYFELVGPYSLEAIVTVARPALLAVAGIVGSTRLIDNLILSP